MWQNSEWMTRAIILLSRSSRHKSAELFTFLRTVHTSARTVDGCSLSRPNRALSQTPVCARVQGIAFSAEVQFFSRRGAEGSREFSGRASPIAELSKIPVRVLAEMANVDTTSIPFLNRFHASRFGVRKQFDECNRCYMSRLSLSSPHDTERDDQRTFNGSNATLPVT